MGDEQLSICYDLLMKAESVKKFSKADLKLIQEVVNWLDEPTEDFVFSFSLSQYTNGEGVYIGFSHDGECFRISETHHSYEAGVGGDTYTAYNYISCGSYKEEEGDIYSFENQAMGLLDFYEDNSNEFDISVSREIN